MIPQLCLGSGHKSVFWLTDFKDNFAKFGDFFAFFDDFARTDLILCFCHFSQKLLNILWLPYVFSYLELNIVLS